MAPATHSGRRSGAQGPETAGQGQASVLLVELRLLDALVLGAPVLEPDLDLRLRQLQALGQLEAARPADVLAALVLQLQPEGLLARERGALAPLPAVLAPSPLDCVRTSHR